MSLKGCKERIANIKKYIDGIDLCVTREEYEDIQVIVENVKYEVESMEDELDEIGSKADDIKCNIEMLEG